MKKTFTLIYLLLAVPLMSWAQQKPVLMPLPQQVSWAEGQAPFRLNSSFRISLEGEVHPRLFRSAERFLRNLDNHTGLFFQQQFLTEADLGGKEKLHIVVEKKGELSIDMQEQYELDIKTGQIVLKATSDLGAIRGLETLSQLVQADAKGYYISAVQIQDAPRFRWRGLMLDVSRHFMPINVIKRQLDLMAAMKLNVFHWHLTDDQGFRVECKAYPKLHEKGSDGLYYTQQELKAIVKYADERGIRVVPEFDVPGHATAILTAYPELASSPYQYMAEAPLVDTGGHAPPAEIPSYHIERHTGIFDATLDPTNEKTYEVLFGLFDEMAAIFPDFYFHIGGDENEGKQWDRNPKIQAFMKEHGLEDNHALQGYFNQRLLKHLTGLNKKMMGWDEILHPSLPKNAVIHSWRGKESLYQAAKQGYQAVLSNGYYIDLMHNTAHHYLNDPLSQASGLTAAEESRILGAEATMWAEHIKPHNVDSRIWPRMASIAERYWSAASVKDVEDMYNRLGQIELLLERRGSTHIAFRNRLFRELCNGLNTEPLEVLAAVSGPLKIYYRNPKGTYYSTYYSFNKFADAVTAEAPAARAFQQLTATYLTDPSKKEAVAQQLKQWSENHKKLKPIIDQSPVLQEIEGLSARFSKAASYALAALDKDSDCSEEWYQQALEAVEAAREQGGRSELKVLTSLERIIKYHTGRIRADISPSKIKIDGSLDEWEGSHWNSAMPEDRYSRDSLAFALRWDQKNLYMAFKVRNWQLKAKHTQRDAEGLHTDDGIEFLIDPQYDRSMEWQDDDIAYHVNVVNALLDEKGNDKAGYNRAWNGKAETAVQVQGTVNDPSDKDRGYTVEVAISWKELGIEPKKGQKLGINLCVNGKSDDAKNSYSYYDYQQLPFFHLPAGFATLILE